MKTKSITIVVGIVIFFSLYSCKEDAIPEFAEYPYVLLTGITDIKSDGANFHANITNLGNQEIIDYGFAWEQGLTEPTIYSVIKSFGHEAAIGEFAYRASADLEKGLTYSVRAYIKTNEVIVYSNILKFISQGGLPPEINSFYPDSGSAGKIIKIIGKNFSSILNNNKVNFGLVQANVVKASIDTLIVQCPDISETQSVDISVEVAKKIHFSNSKFKLIYPWEKINDFVCGGRMFSSSCVLDSMGYTVLGNLRGSTCSAKNLWQFNSRTKEWLQLKDFPSMEREHATSFSANNLIYFGMGFNSNTFKYYNDLWAYNPLTDEWFAKSVFPGEESYQITSFVINNTVYLYSYAYSTNEFWKYYPISDTWQKINNIIQTPWVTFTTSYEGIGYLITEEGQIWQFNPSTESLILLIDLNQKKRINDGFRIGSILYLIVDNYLKSYDLKNGYQINIKYPCGSYPHINLAFTDRAYLSPALSLDCWEFYPR